MIDREQIEAAYALTNWNGVARYFVKGAGWVGGGSTNSAAGLVRLMEKYDGNDCYILLNPAENFYGVKPPVSAITHLRWVLLDIDPKAPNADVMAARYDVMAALEGLLGALPEEAVVRLDTGRGQQVWVPLFEPVAVTEETDGLVKAFVQHIAKQVPGQTGCIVDTSCAELSRVARMPGTTNTKTGRLARFDFSFADFVVPRLTINMMRSVEPIPAPLSSLPLPEHPNMGQIIARLNRTATEFLLLGTRHSTTDSRHAAMFATAKQLREMGLSVDIARGMLLTGAALCVPPLEVAEVIRVLGQTFPLKG